MEFNAYAGQRVLYKINGHNWKVGTLVDASFEEEGLYFSIHDLDNENYNISVPINNIFFNARKLEDWETAYIYSKEHFLELIENEEVSSKNNEAWMSDGEYAYYTIGKWNKNWITKQPFKYIFCI